MKTDGLNLPGRLCAHFTQLGYRSFHEERPSFGGVILHLYTVCGREEAAYYLAKPSTFEVISSDELRRTLDFLQGSGTPLRHVVTTSRFSSGANKLAAAAEIVLWTLQPWQVEIASLGWPPNPKGGD